MKIKKAVLTGGGRATRLYPITTTINKHLLPLANKPMIFHAIEKLVEAGIEEIFINTNPGETELQKHVGDGSRWGIRITFFEQTGGPQGIAHVVHLAEKFINDEPFVFYLADNILAGSLVPLFQAFATEGHDCMLTLSEVPDPERFGVPVFDENKKLVDVVEKPKNPTNNFAVTGIYFYGPKIFFDAFAHIEKSARGEYEISSIHSYLLKQGKKVGYKEVTGWWKDTGKSDDMLLANKLLLDNMDKAEFKVPFYLAARTDGNVQIGDGAIIGKNVILRGPVMIGKNCSLDNAEIGPYATIGDEAKLTNVKVRNSIVLDRATLAGIELENSLLGKEVVITKNAPVSGASMRMIVGDRTVISC